MSSKKRLLSNNTRLGNAIGKLGAPREATGMAATFGGWCKTPSEASLKGAGDSQEFGWRHAQKKEIY